MNNLMIIIGIAINILGISSIILISTTLICIVRDAINMLTNNEYY